MNGLPVDIGARIAQALASGDRAAAADLAGRIAAAQASGDAWGFGDDLAKLQALAGVPVTKAAVHHAGDVFAKALLAEPLAPDMAARVASVTALAKRAQTPAEVCQAKEAIDRLAGDIRAHALLKAALATPRTMGCQL